jgi:aspartate kinase
MQQVVYVGIPIRVLNVIRPKGQGTMIAASKAITISKKSGFTLSRGKSFADLTILGVPQKPTAVTVKRSVVLLNIRSNRKIGAPGFLSQVFQILNKQNLSAAPIASSEVNVSLGLHSEIPMVLHTIDEDGNEKIAIKDKRLRKACEKLEQLGDVDVRTNMAILSLVGQGLKNMIGISGRFFGVLGEAGINVEMISQGQSLLFLLSSVVEINI